MYEEWIKWGKDASLVAMFYEPVLKSMPAGSVYFGGTDAGRFWITMMNEVEDAGILCLTQNALADNTYMGHVRYFYGDRLRLPTLEETSTAFQEYVEGVRSGRIPNHGGIEFANGRVTVSGARAVMEINGILLKNIFEWDRGKHGFFIEESYSIEWMKPYLRPCGAILKVETKPLPPPREDPEFLEKTTAEDDAFGGEAGKRLVCA